MHLFKIWPWQSVPISSSISIYNLIPKKQFQNHSALASTLKLQCGLSNLKCTNVNRLVLRSQQTVFLVLFSQNILLVHVSASPKFWGSAMSLLAPLLPWEIITVSSGTSLTLRSTQSLSGMWPKRTMWRGAAQSEMQLSEGCKPLRTGSSWQLQRTKRDLLVSPPPQFQL